MILIAHTRRRPRRILALDLLDTHRMTKRQREQLDRDYRCPFTDQQMLYASLVASYDAQTKRYLVLKRVHGRGVPNRQVTRVELNRMIAVDLAAREGS